jgi:Holliday junction DNA helicase RuvA
MISRLRGVPAGRTADGLVLDVGGVGYLLAATPSALRRAEGGEEVTLETYLHVREDALQLYGFADTAERELFLHLLGVSGIGPKVALAIVSSAPPGELRRAIVLEDPARFQAIPGIGKKTAERIGLELKDRLPRAAQVAGPAAPAASPGDQLRDDLISALLNLGYQRAAAEKAVENVLKADPSPAFEQALRDALRSMMKGHGR